MSSIFLKFEIEYQTVKANMPKNVRKPNSPVSPKARKKSLSVDSASVKSSICSFVSVEYPDPKIGFLLKPSMAFGHV